MGDSLTTHSTSNGPRVVLLHSLTLARARTPPSHASHSDAPHTTPRPAHSDRLRRVHPAPRRRRLAHGSVDSERTHVRKKQCVHRPGLCSALPQNPRGRSSTRVRLSQPIALSQRSSRSTKAVLRAVRWTTDGVLEWNAIAARWGTCSSRAGLGVTEDRGRRVYEDD